MAKIVIEIKDCTGCPFHEVHDSYSTDGWDNMETWYCKKEEKKIAGGVEWFDKVPIPDWCPILIKEE